MPPERPSATKKPGHKKFKAPRPAKSSASRRSVPESSAIDDESPSQASRTDKEPPIPLPLLSRLLHEFFDGEGSKVSKDANEVVGKYLETFVREALARASMERGQDAAGGSGNILEVSLLMRAALMSAAVCGLVCLRYTPLT
ncbi:MAG: hypothetical protein M1837_006983 [Sclerophora amabilis]|nr:MAG: hypothetical protein M1837_006983 [Sclerophora amabilis]